MDLLNCIPDDLKHIVMEAAVTWAVTGTLDLLVENKHLFLAYGEACWNNAVVLVTQMANVGQQSYDVAVFSVGRACNQMVELIEQSRACGYYHCMKSFECVKGIPTLELPWA